ncbi:MAG: asparaginase [Ignavibacteria bacterium CG2_30_36_16]|nr:MAG: asparaginase [Ignavibacteria bacterium CG2_30_36_16]
MKRRTFIKSTALGVGAAVISNPLLIKAAAGQTNINNEFPIAIASANGIRAVDKAVEMMNDGSDAIDAVIKGVNIIEADPDDMSVGYGGLPNEEGVVELDSCCMHGPTHNAGAVASLRNIKHPSQVAKLVMQRTDHVLLAGEGALRFAKAHGFKEEDLLTDKAREVWLYWKESLSNKDNWFTPGEEEKIPEEIRKHFGITGTITCLGIDKQGNISGVTTTSGLAFKIPGRVGDSPIIGAGLYVDNEVGACGSTGRGEENLKNLTCFLIVEFMRQGMTPTEACMAGVKRVVLNTKIKSLIDEKGKINYNVSYYALNKKGEFGAASIYGPHEYSININGKGELKKADFLYENKN